MILLDRPGRTPGTTRVSGDMIKSFQTKISFYQREESITYYGTFGSLWVLWVRNHFCGCTFVPGSRPTRERVMESLYHSGTRGTDY